MSSTRKARPRPDIERLIAERFPEGLLRVLGGKFPSASYADRQDAVSAGFEKLTIKGQTTNPEGYVTTVAVNAMRRTLRKAAVERLALDADEDESPADPWSDPTFEAVDAENAYTFIKQTVERWESRNVRTTTLLVAEAAKVGEPLSSEELSERLEELLGQDVLPDTARQWRKRGLDRLRRELVAADLLQEKENE